jgi:hypothetical protein
MKYDIAVMERHEAGADSDHSRDPAAGSGVDLPRLAGAVVLDEAGIELRASELWADQPSVIGFLRHFGCMFCREQATLLTRAEPEMNEVGGRLVVVGNGAPRFIAEFRQVTEFEGPVYTDPSREAYRACGFTRSVGSNVNLRSARRAIEALSRGFRQGRTQGDPWQQGGALVLAPGDKLLSVQRARYAGDHVDIDELIAALAGAGA